MRRGQEGFQALGGNGRAEQEALHLVAAEPRQGLPLLLALHTLGDHFQRQRVGHVNDGSHDGLILETFPTLRG